MKARKNGRKLTFYTCNIIYIFPFTRLMSNDMIHACVNLANDMPEELDG